MKPIIGISGNWAPFEKGRNGIPDKTFSYIIDDYIEAVIRAGGIPWVIPIVDDISIVPEFLSRIDGLIMSGGGDLHPDMWGAEHYSQYNMYVRPKRDKFEWHLFLESKVPTLGICRGHQLIALALGGDMYQDLSEVGKPTFDHRKRPEGYLPMHEVKIKENTILSKILGSNTYNANSSHHQVISRIPQGFIESGVSVEDNLNEAFEGVHNGQDVVCVQWHPEAMPSDIGSKALFSWLVESANEFRMANVKSQSNDTENPRDFSEYS